MVKKETPSKLRECVGEESMGSVCSWGRQSKDDLGSIFAAISNWSLVSISQGSTLLF